MKRIFFIIFTVICILFTSILTVNGQEKIDSLPDIMIPQKPISQEEKQNCIEDLNLRVVAYDPKQYKNAWMTGLDVSQTEMIAVAFNNESVVIADKDFNVQCVLQFDTHDLYHYINWNGTNLELFFNRSDKVYTVSPNGLLLDIQSYEIGSIASSKAFDKQSDTVNGNTYTIKASNPSMFLTLREYDILEKTDISGNRHILFHSEKNTPILHILFFCFLGAGLLFFAIYIPVSTVRMNKTDKDRLTIKNQDPN